MQSFPEISDSDPCNFSLYKKERHLGDVCTAQTSTIFLQTNDLDRVKRRFDEPNNEKES